MESHKTYLGVDYSMPSPCICLHDKYEYSFHYLTKTKKYEGYWEIDGGNVKITGHLMPKFDDDIDRWDSISGWVMRTIEDWTVDYAFLEDYSFGSTGRTFQIGENFGLLKYKLRLGIIPWLTVPPTVLKKFATGKGNAKKEDMQEAFIKETGWDIKAALQQTEKQWNPSSDIIDAYFLVEYGKHKENEEE